MMSILMKIGLFLWNRYNKQLKKKALKELKTQSEIKASEVLSESNATQLRRKIENILIDLAKKAKEKTPDWNVDDQLVLFWQRVFKSNRIKEVIDGK